MKLNFKKIDGPSRKTPVVILHGLFGSLDNWLTVAKKLAVHHPVYLLDQRNHGQSPHSDEFSYDLMSRDLQEFLIEQALEEIHLVGHSMGGKTAMHFALSFPEHLTSLTIVDIAPRHYPPHHQDILSAFEAVDPPTLSSREQAVERISQVISNKGIQLFLLKNLQRLGQGRFEWKHNLPAIRNNIDSIGEALNSSTQFAGPCLFIAGSNSDYIMQNDQHEIRSFFPNAEINSIEGAGHWVHAEKPTELIQSLLSFYSNTHV